MEGKDIEKPIVWLGSSKRDLLAMPRAIHKVFGHALHLAQIGQRYESTKVLQGFGSASILEVIEDYPQIRIELFIPFGLKTGFMCCTALRRNHTKVDKHLSLIWS